MFGWRSFAVSSGDPAFSSTFSSSPAFGSDSSPSNKTSNGGSGGAFCVSFSPPQTRKCKARRKAYKHASFATNIASVESATISDDSQPMKQTVQQELFIFGGVNLKSTEIKHNHDQVSDSPSPMVLVSRILKGIPQSPHFLQLRRYSEMTRENLMAAWDRTFEETVDQIHALRAAEFWVRASKLWKTLEELQSLGYNVLVLRKRVVELSDVVLDHKKCEHEIHGLRNRAELHRMEKSRVESVILNLKAQAQREHEWMVQVLENVADKEKDLPKLEGMVAKLASEPVEV